MQILLLLLHIWSIHAMETSGEANISRHPPVVTVTMRESVVLPCHLPRGWITKNYEVQWYRTPGPGGARSELNRWAINISSPALPSRFSHVEDKASLRIASVAAEDVGVYFCVATLRQGEFREKFRGNDTKLRVLDIISRNPTVGTFTNGASVYLPCILPFWVTLKYRVEWYRTPGPGGAVTAISSPALPPRFSLKEEEDVPLLLIAPVAVEDAGVYFCESTAVPGEPQYQDSGTELRVLAMETNGWADVIVVTATSGGSVVLPCRLYFGIIQYAEGKVKWYGTPGPAGAQDEPRRWGGAAVISSPALPPRFSHVEEEDKASLQITPVAVEDEGVYFCVVTLMQGKSQREYRGAGTKLRVLAPPSAPQLFLQAPPDLWSGQWNLFCVTRGFHSNEVRLSWTQNGAESELQDCTPGSADPGPVQSNGTVRQNLTLEEKDDSAPNGWLPVSLAMEAKPLPHQRCIYVTDSSGRGPYLVSVLPISLGPAVRVTYTCALHAHPVLLNASFKWEPPSDEVIRRLNIFKICILSGLTLVLSVAALYSRLKKREP